MDDFSPSALPNLLEPLRSRGNKDHSIISHEFVVVQLFQTCSSHSTAHGTRPAVELDMSSGWFNHTEPSRTGGMAKLPWEMMLCSLFPTEPLSVIWGHAVMGRGSIHTFTLQNKHYNKALVHSNTIIQFGISFPLAIWSLFVWYKLGHHSTPQVELGIHSTTHWASPGVELSYDPCFLWNSAVQGGSVGFNWCQASHQFGVVQPYWSSSNHWAPEGKGIIG